MTGMLNTSLSALRSYQQALTTTSGNISNANTEGYSRQRVDLQSLQSQRTSVGDIGTGVQVSRIQRYFDQAVTDQLRNTTASFNQQDTLYTLATQLQSLLTDINTGVDGAVSNFFNSLQGVANDPSSLAARRVFLDDAKALTVRFNDLDAQFNALNTTVNTEVGTAVTDINQLTKRIADLNISITKTSAAPSSELLDERDQALVSLNKLVKVSTSTNADGSVNVFVGNSEPVVFGSTQIAMQQTLGTFNPLEVRLSVGNRDVTDELSGGTLGGSLDFRNNLLRTARSELSMIGYTLATQFNTQNTAGRDLLGNTGTDLFNVAAPVAITNSTNKGTGSVSLAIDPFNAGDMTGKDYLLRIVGGQPRLYRQPDQTSVALTGTVPNLSAEGLKITLGGTPVEGDEFLLQPSTNVSSQLKLMVTDPARIAAAADDGTPFGRGDNRNVLKMVDIETNKTLVNGTVSLRDQLRGLLSDVAASTRQADVARQSQSTLLDQAIARRDNVSGVNLDEEAANLLRFQQSYQAAAQAIQVANSLFDTLLGAVSR